MKAMVSSEAVSFSSTVKVTGCFIIFDALTALVMSVAASSTAVIQSLFALTPVVGNMAPIVTLIGGVVGLLLLSPQPPMAAGINNDKLAPRRETFCEILVVGWLM